MRLVPAAVFLLVLGAAPASKRPVGMAIELALDRNETVIVPSRKIAGADWQSLVVAVPSGRRVHGVTVHYGGHSLTSGRELLVLAK